MDLEKFNRDWLNAWTTKDVVRLLSFYNVDAEYKDPQTAMGLKGHDALRDYLKGLFASTPPMMYEPEEIWSTRNGFCGRWYCKIGPGGEIGRLRGFDLVVLRDDKIALNEVYVHQLPTG